jgi:phage baseplate assembly protein W
MARLFNQKTVAVNKASVGDADQGQFTYKGFNSNNTTKNFKLYDLELVKQDIINHFYIRKGEKLENPDFGTVIWDMLFEPFNDQTKEIIAKDVEDIVNYDPRVIVNSITVDSTDMGIRIEAEITYIPFNVNESMTFDFDRNNAVIN